MAKFQHGTSYKEMPSGLKIFAGEDEVTAVLAEGRVDPAFASARPTSGRLPARATKRLPPADSEAAALKAPRA